MSDRYGDFVQSGLGKKIAKNLGLPTPSALERYEAGQPVLTGEVLVGFVGDDISVKQAVLDLLSRLHAHLSADPETIAFAQGFLGTLADSNRTMHDEHSRFKTVIFDATNLKNVNDLSWLYEFFHPIMKKIKSSGRIIIIGRPECCTTDVEYAIAQRSLEGFVKSVAKEAKKGISANLIYVKKGLERHMDSTLCFFMSSKSAYVSGQAIYILNETPVQPMVNTEQPLLGQKILVTGASRGIGAAISEVLVRDGAEVICLDIPEALADLQRSSGKIGAKALPLDITDGSASDKIMQAVGSLDGVVHNAGITRDKTLAKMSKSQWQSVMDVNVRAVHTLNKTLLAKGGLTENARIVCVSSISGIAGNVGQTNYAASKAGVIGLTAATAKAFFGTGRTINAVAPGFIETKMTAALPFAIREAGRRMNSMSQGGEPVDVAETIAWLLNPASLAINGNVVRVCGQSVLGA